MSFLGAQQADSELSRRCGATAACGGSPGAPCVCRVRARVSARVRARVRRLGISLREYGITSCGVSCGVLIKRGGGALLLLLEGVLHKVYVRETPSSVLISTSDSCRVRAQAGLHWLILTLTLALIGWVRARGGLHCRVPSFPRARRGVHRLLGAEGPERTCAAAQCSFRRHRGGRWIRELAGTPTAEQGSGRRQVFLVG